MCCGGGGHETPENYRIHRLDNGPGHHDRRRSSVERHLSSSPPVVPNYKGKKYPHRFNDNTGLFPRDNSLYEYPTRPYPYHEQNSKGKTKSNADKGYTRTVTDRNKNIKGVMYHPHGDPTGFARADEHYRGGKKVKTYKAHPKKKKKK